ncbi:hypothetical protein RJ55_02868 [Drechmeria coniospora]|nr:hypothetical protein RJ55_02868 [Drechmeria coniospora]
MIRLPKEVLPSTGSAVDWFCRRLVLPSIGSAVDWFCRRLVLPSIGSAVDWMANTVTPPTAIQFKRLVSSQCPATCLLYRRAFSILQCSWTSWNGKPGKQTQPMEAQLRKRNNQTTIRDDDNESWIGC